MRNYILAGRTNTGITAVAEKILAHLRPDIADKWLEDDIIDMDHMPDVNGALVRIPLGRDGACEGLTLFDTPGLTADDPELENTARLALGLPQTGAAKDKLTHIAVTTTGHPDANNGAEEVESTDTLPIEDIEAYINRKALGCIYVLDASETRFMKKYINTEIADLRAIYRNRFFIVATHQDVLDMWETEPRKRRYRNIKEATDGQYTWVNGKTGEGIEDLILTLGGPRLRQTEFEDLCLKIENVIHSYIDKKELDAFVMSKEIEDELEHESYSAVFHRLDRPISAIVGGHTNSGKTSVVRQIFSDIAAKINYGGEVLDIGDMPDVTHALVSIPFGRDEMREGLTLFDTPGLTADDPELENTARLALGLPQTGAAKDKLTHIQVETLGRPDANGIADITSTNAFPINEIDSYVKRSELYCIYILDASETPFKESDIKPQIVALRAIYQERFLIVATHKDVIDTWRERQQERRYVMLNNITGGQHIWLNGKTGEGLWEFAQVFLVEKNNYDVQELAAQMKVEYRGARLFEASHNLSDILMGAFFSERLQKQPDELLYPSLELVVALALESIYGDSEEGSETGVTAAVKQIVEDYVKTRTYSKKQSRATRGVKEWFKKTFTKWQPEETVEVSEAVIEDRVTLLAYLYYVLYAQIYSRETAPEEHIYNPETGEIDPQTPVGTAITRELVPEETAINWFTAEFAPYKDLIEDAENAWIFYQIVGPVLSRFWQAHHPEVLPITRN